MSINKWESKVLEAMMAILAMYWEGSNKDSNITQVIRIDIDHVYRIVLAPDAVFIVDRIDTENGDRFVELMRFSNGIKRVANAVETIAKCIKDDAKHH